MSNKWILTTLRPFIYKFDDAIENVIQQSVLCTIKLEELSLLHYTNVDFNLFEFFPTKICIQYFFNLGECLLKM